jgi:hypothetical protein
MDRSVPSTNADIRRTGAPDGAGAVSWSSVSPTVLDGEVVPEGVDGWLPAERAVGSVVIVEVHEPGVGVVALAVGAPGADVGPLLEQDAVEPLDLAVGLRPVGAGARVADTGLGERGGPVA